MGRVIAEELGVRERKKRALRARLSDTATVMFSEHGYDNVRVGDIAAACGVTAKTLYSYFPTKESLLFERGTALAEVFDAEYEDGDALFSAVLDAIRREIDQLATTAPTSTASAGHDLVNAVQGFVSLAASTPTLRAAAAERSEALTQQAATAMSRLNGLPPSSPENQVAAAALMSLWRIHLVGLLHYSSTSSTLSDLRRTTMTDVDRGAKLVRPIIEAMTSTTRSTTAAPTASGR